MILQIDCPHCHREITVPADVQTICPQCRGRVIGDSSVVRAQPCQAAAAAPPWWIQPGGFFLFITVPALWWAWSLGAPSTPRASTPAPNVVPRQSSTTSRISQAELQRLIAEVYQVETSRFITRDLLWITLPTGAAVQKNCQAIANLWAHRSGLDYVRVESWRGTQRLGQGTVNYGQIRTP